MALTSQKHGFNPVRTLLWCHKNTGCHQRQRHRASLFSRFSLLWCKPEERRLFHLRCRLAEACFGASRRRRRNKGRNPCITARGFICFCMRIVFMSSLLQTRDWSDAPKIVLLTSVTISEKMTNTRPAENIRCVKKSCYFCLCFRKEVAPFLPTPWLK